MDCTIPGFPVFYYLLEFAQTHVHWVSDAIQPSCPLSSTSPPSLNLCQHQGLFQWVDSSYQVAKGFELQHQFFQWIFRVYLLWDWLIWSPCCPGDSQESSPAPWFKSINSSALFMVQLSHPYMTTGKLIALTIHTFVGKVISLLFNMLSRFVTAFLLRRGIF